MPMWFIHSFRLFRHELKRGELTIVALAIILSVTAVFSLTGFTEQIKQSLLDQSSSFIAADRVLTSGRKISQDILSEADEKNIRHVEQVEMASMLFAGNNMQMVSLKVSAEGYPLRGELLVKTHIDKAAENKGIPKQGSVWVDDAAAKKLAISIGDKVDIGAAQLTVGGIIDKVPDASFNVFNSNPLVILNIADLASTKLVQPASRLNYKYLFAGEKSTLKTFDEYVKTQLNEAQRWRSIQSGNSRLANALKRAEQYLSLGSMLGILLAATAIFVASRRYSQRHQLSVAIFKALGASKKYITKVYILHWALLTVSATMVGLFIGYLLLSIGLSLITDIFEISPQRDYLYAFFMAVLTGFTCAISFALKPFVALVVTSPMKVLRGSLTAQQKSWLYHLITFSSVFLLLLLFSKSLSLTAGVVVGAVVVIAILVLLAQLLMNLGRNIGGYAGSAWHLALANLKKRSQENLVQLISFTIAIKLLLILVVVKGALIQEWQAQLPEDTANRFLININKEQKAELADFVKQNDIIASGIYPVVRGRLTAINGEKVRKKVTKEEDGEAEQGRRGVGRELNLTWQEKLPPKNTVQAGNWWQAGDDIQQVSIESGVAERLNILLGDELSFLIGINEVNAKVTSIRDVDWESMQPNFFMILHPELLAEFPATYINAMKIEPQHQQVLDELLIANPTISVINVEEMIEQLRSVIDKVSIALQFVLVLVVLAGCLVLVAQVQASMEERERELAILRTLGAKGIILKMSVLYEFLALGFLAGLMASMAMEIGVYILQTQLFDMSPSFHFSYWLLGILAGGVFVALVGFLSCRRLLNLSSVTLIRRTL